MTNCVTIEGYVKHIMYQVGGMGIYYMAYTYSVQLIVDIFV